MRVPPRATLTFAVAALYAAALFSPALAQSGFQGIMVEEGGGKPAAKKGKPAAKPSARPRPRGSSYIPSTTLPRTQPIIVAPSPGVYQPPRIDSFSDRVTRCNHSFPLNAGIGNNPTDRGAYVRQCAN